MKLRAPKFWSVPKPGPRALLLCPVSHIVARITRRRLKKPGYHAPVPVLCCGNITAGGTGKTPLTLDLATRLKARGHHPHILSRGFGGRERGPLAVDSHRSTPRDVGDEPLLLAQIAPTWIGADRAQTAQLATAQGADCLLMDDGLQNPGLHKTVSILVIDGTVGFGNGQVIPAGPLRETPADALKRTHAIVLIGEDRHALLKTLPEHLLKTQARLIPGPEIRTLQGKRIIAFAGIGRPEKFFSMLRESGVTPIRCLPFPDHHTYSPTDIQRLETLSRESGTTLVTTTKDAIKLPPTFRSSLHIITAELLWADPTAPERILDMLFNKT